MIHTRTARTRRPRDCNLILRVPFFIVVASNKALLADIFYGRTHAQHSIAVRKRALARL